MADDPGFIDRGDDGGVGILRDVVDLFLFAACEGELVDDAGGSGDDV